MPDEDPVVGTNETRDGTREPAIGSALDDENADADQSGTSDGSQVIEQRIEEVKQKAREMGDGDSS
ncbi:MAG: hypothetical protein DLM67_00220 [Candidatus Nephthysia bennettiae]|uniref:Uncharacterized protein n=1 Tax=Candidatus Nephthysia bennettiae TaxID=3127016 RepID=A0A934K826_9BACT|nr:hypothetical protein [Candidatus Dormibacteraeota bacterium]MBJ7613338.1 hypothetical protein [Candidatus Dormibacteraeota bacterium]PZS00887.1 MAG: hypothetical protein DLM67_00220 [Candidatus Dormibacteraeota bacterium]